jgi:hypothetical protein
VRLGQDIDPTGFYPEEDADHRPAIFTTSFFNQTCCFFGIKPFGFPLASFGQSVRCTKTLEL